MTGLPVIAGDGAAAPSGRKSAEPVLVVDDLNVTFATPDGPVHAVRGVSFSVDEEEVVGIVGESGSGKSVTAMTLMGLTRSPNAQFGGTARLRGQELITASDDELRRVRGKEIAMIFQDPMTSLNPVHRIGAQIVINRLREMLAEETLPCAPEVKLEVSVGVAIAGEDGATSGAGADGRGSAPA